MELLKNNKRYIYWAGDSTVQYNDITTFPQTGIGQVLNLYLSPDVEIRNFAKNGRSTKSFIDEGRLSLIENKIKKGDFLFIQFGHNDEKVHDPARYTNPNGEFVANLNKFIDAARSRGAHPVLITPLERRQFDDEGCLTQGEHGEYVASCLLTAEKLNVPVIDLNRKSRDLLAEAGVIETKKWYMNLEAGMYKAYPEGKVDNTHLKYEGAVVFAGCVAQGLEELGGIYKELLLALD